MEPVRVKLYGFLPVTKRGYLIQLAAAGLLLIGLLFLWTYLPPQPSLQKGMAPPPSNWIWMALHNLPWVVVGIAVLYGIEAMIILRRFARKEAAQRAGPPGSLGKP